MTGKRNLSIPFLEKVRAGLQITTRDQAGASRNDETSKAKSEERNERGSLEEHVNNLPHTARHKSQANTHENDRGNREHRHSLGFIYSFDRLKIRNFTFLE